jgi:hypothetical protein
MLVDIINVDYFLSNDPNEGTVTFISNKGNIIEAFSYDESFVLANNIQIELSSLDEGINWDAQKYVSDNSEIYLKQIENWKYEGIGRVINLNPLYLDFQDFILKTENFINDESLKGKLIYYKINRLDISLV